MKREPFLLTKRKNAIFLSEECHSFVLKITNLPGLR